MKFSTIASLSLAALFVSGAAIADAQIILADSITGASQSSTGKGVRTSAGVSTYVYQPFTLNVAADITSIDIISKATPGDTTTSNVFQMSILSDNGGTAGSVIATTDSYTDLFSLGAGITNLTPGQKYKYGLNYSTSVSLSSGTYWLRLFFPRQISHVWVETASVSNTGLYGTIDQGDNQTGSLAGLGQALTTIHGNLEVETTPEPGSFALFAGISTAGVGLLKSRRSRRK